MKKVFFIATLAAATLFFGSSCSKSTPAPDLTTNLVGTYNGGVQDSVTGGTSSTVACVVTVTKVDNSHVQVSSSVPAYLNTFTATVSTAPNGLWLTVQPANGVSGSNLGNGYPGAFTNNTLSLGLSVATSTSTVLQFYVGTHQ